MTVRDRVVDVGTLVGAYAVVNEALRRGLSGAFRVPEVWKWLDRWRRP